MATAKYLRAKIIEIADEAFRHAPADIDERARYFIASLSGSMAHIGEDAVDSALCKVLGMCPASLDGA